MNKFLVAVSVLSLAPGAAFSAEWTTRITGYYNLGVAYSDIEGQSDGFGVLRDGEAYIRAKLQADNGLTFGARVELEAFTASDQIDENYGYV